MTLLVLLLAAVSAPPTFPCGPNPITRTTAELRLDPPGRELAVVDPDGVFFFLAFTGRGPELPETSPPVPSTLDPRALEGWRLEAGKYRWERVFRKPGWYEFRSADVLESDYSAPDQVPLHVCRVRMQ